MNAKAKEEKSMFAWFAKISKELRILILTIAVSGLGGAALFGYNHISLPADKKRIDDLQSHIETIEKKLSASDVKDAVTQTNILNIINTVDKFSKKTDDQFNRLYDKMDENTRIVKKL